MSREMSVLENVKKIFRAVVYGDLKSVCFFASPGFVIRATVVGKPRSNARTKEIRLSFGAPNHKERLYLKKYPVDSSGTWGPYQNFK
jgi:hypothetical protein